jgi:hypothetical protein
VNQKNVFDYFYRNIEPNKSFVVAYAKAVPFIESSGRVIVGIGFVSSLYELKEYEYDPNSAGKITAFLWERPEVWFQDDNICPR